MTNDAKPERRYQVRPYCEGDEHGIVRGFREAFGSERSLDEWGWRFRPDGVEPTIVVGEGPDGEIVAQYAVSPLAIRLNGHSIGAGQPIDIYCLKRAGTGEERVYVQTFHTFGRLYCGAGKAYQVLYGFPNERALRRGQKEMGYPQNPPPVPIWSLEVLPVWRSRLQRLLPGSKIPRSPGPEPAWLDRLWERCTGRYPVSPVRDGAWLHRRFHSRPAATYHHRWVERDGQPRAWAALRVRGRELRWVDLLWDGDDASDFRDLELQVRELARKAGLTRVELWLMGDSLAAQQLSSLGWSEGRGDHLFFAHRFFDESVDPGPRFAESFYLTLAATDLD